MKCTVCREQAVLALPSHKAGFCRDHFLAFFSRQVAKAIRRYRLFTRQDKILVAVSGGKDSLALALELKEQGYDIAGLNVDLGIPGSSEAALESSEAFCRRHDIPLHVVEVAGHGLAIPQVKKQIKRPVCSACGKIKRHFFNRLALDRGYTVLATGHNLDDEVSRLFSNLINWKIDYLGAQGPLLQAQSGFARKVKPLCRLSEYETAAYCFLRDIDYVTTPCPYSAGASFTMYKSLWRRLEQEQPGRKLHFYEGFLNTGRPVFEQSAATPDQAATPCPICTSPTSADICGVCRIKKMLAGDDEEKAGSKAQRNEEGEG